MHTGMNETRAVWEWKPRYSSAFSPHARLVTAVWYPGSGLSPGGERSRSTEPWLSAGSGASSRMSGAEHGRTDMAEGILPGFEKPERPRLGTDSDGQKHPICPQTTASPRAVRVLLSAGEMTAPSDFSA